mmetsp:Transcript_16877/g.31421  ORF Transcript_16877/g.31421 Transcript_16877/m.31421 type:complete len:558 (-) Transcript_16877:27-1700(-)
MIPEPLKESERQIKNRNSQLNSATREDDGLVFTGKFAGGVRNDVARRAPWYGSDWTDGFRGGVKTFTAGLYMFFACLAPGIAFGAFFDQHSKGESGVVEYLITQSVSGIIFAIISGQPLIMLRPTGPITVFISQLYTITDSLDLPFLSVMAWVGIFVGTYMIIVALTDGCALIRYCSRFTQDLFGCFVSVIFISLGITNLVDKFTDDEKKSKYSPMHQLALTMATLYFALQLTGFSKTRFFNARIRTAISDFAVPLAVVLATVVANVMTADLEPLPVPTKFAPTKASRSWFVDLCPDDDCAACIGIGAVGAIPLFLLFFIDQNVTSLLTQHPDHNLKKGTAFHYNFLLLGIFNIIFPMFGCPYVTGSLPHSPQFTRALATTEMVRVGKDEKVRIVGVCENRVSPLMVNVLILICLPVIGELSYIPTAVVCDALFLFMGITGLPGNELFERLKLLITEPALYPTMHFTEQDVPRSRMHFFTIFQFSFVAILYAVARSPIALAFPIFLVSSIPARMFLARLSCNFISQDMVDLLDHRRREDKDTSCDDGAEADPDFQSI